MLPSPAKFILTFLQLIIRYDQKGNRDDEEVENEAYLAQLADGGPTQPLDHRLVGALAADGRRVAQYDEATDQEHQRDLGVRTCFKDEACYGYSQHTQTVCLKSQWESKYH